MGCRLATHSFYYVYNPHYTDGSLQTKLYSRIPVIGYTYYQHNTNKSA